MITYLQAASSCLKAYFKFDDAQKRKAIIERSGDSVAPTTAKKLWDEANDRLEVDDFLGTVEYALKSLAASVGTSHHDYLETKAIIDNHKAI